MKKGGGGGELFAEDTVHGKYIIIAACGSLTVKDSDGTTL